MIRPIIEERVRADKEFHHALAAASHNIVYSAMLNSFDTVADKLVRMFYEKDIDLCSVVRLHERIIDAVKSGNQAEAGKHMKTLLDHGEFELRK